ncbi:MAG: cytochrome-c oxidase, cbb3-type subunit II [Rhizobiales bacterium]|nr:cytochrome-c oxidase, cbb3-type subunit II [Hyphomicrobiales bacterium]MBO6697337.1 cytochrome-c oxidase, cbb3-type subunit II [Hyphomicrobiales bacterium]MBO6736408.1 cytochrome-c oxidase, cbb3-type subunit II [Hyphomicrobiales bacterium]MBO6912878.1 cytochrome-c oxidase, cbb3-type subunit II [Hyphomicrobiales bacterium]MBO6954046.1 cytochrome-c oxidase, cbb3-type subunit II [Hyphomicrobiales bacterium]
MLNHGIIEKSTPLMLLLILLSLIVGGMVQIIPLYKVESTIEPVSGVRPYSPLEQIGRNLYMREGCYNCHSQQVRPFRDEVDRYGHYSLAAEGVYDYPFLWGSKRTGPDLARVGGKYSNEWHAAHLRNPQAVLPESIMPDYAFLERPLDYDDIELHMRTLRFVGVPYTDADIEAARDDIIAQAVPTIGDATALRERYADAPLGPFTGNDEEVTEMDAMIAYLQVLGTMVDFTTFDPETMLQGQEVGR